MTSSRKNKKKLNDKLRQVYKELKIDEQDKKAAASSTKPKDPEASKPQEPEAIASAGSLTVIQMQDVPEKEDKAKPAEDKKFDKLASSIEKLAKGLTGKFGIKGGDDEKPGSFISRGLKDYAGSKVEQIKQATSAEGILGLAGVNPGEGLIGSLLGAHMANRDAKRQAKEDEETYIKTFSESTEGGRSLSKEDQQKVGKELYLKEKKGREELAKLEEKEKVAKAFGGSLSKEDMTKVQQQKAILDEVATTKRGGPLAVEEEVAAPEDAPKKKKKKAEETSEEVSKTTESTTVSKETESKEFIKERAELIKEVLAGVDDAVKNATQEQKAELFSKGGEEYVIGVKKGIMEELLKINQEQLEELKRATSVDPKDTEERILEKTDSQALELQKEEVANDKTVEKNETEQTKLLKEVYNKLTTSEEDKLEKGKKAGPSLLETGKKVLDKGKEGGGILDSVMGLFDSVKGLRSVGGLLKVMGPLVSALGGMIGPALAVTATFVAAYKLGSWINDKLFTGKNGENKIVDAAESLGAGPMSGKVDKNGGKAENLGGASGGEKGARAAMDEVYRNIIEKRKRDGFLEPIDVENAERLGIDVKGIPIGKWDSKTRKMVALDTPEPATMAQKALTPTAPAVVAEKVAEAAVAPAVAPAASPLPAIESFVEEVPPGASLPSKQISLAIPGSQPKFQYQGSLLAAPAPTSLTPEAPATPNRVALLGEMKRQEEEQTRQREEKEAKAATIISNSNNKSTVVNNNNGDSGGKTGRSTSRPADGLNEDRYQFLQRRLVF